MSWQSSSVHSTEGGSSSASFHSLRDAPDASRCINFLIGFKAADDGQQIEPLPDSEIVKSVRQMRIKLARSLSHRLFCAGEASEQNSFGTAHGACLSGLRAAGEVLAV